MTVQDPSRVIVIEAEIMNNDNTDSRSGKNKDGGSNSREDHDLKRSTIKIQKVHNEEKLWSGRSY